LKADILKATQPPYYRAVRRRTRLERWNWGARGPMMVMLLIGILFGIVTLSVIILVQRFITGP
jgi:hypothetical protein